MKRLLFILLMLPFFGLSQTTYHMRYDTVRIYKQGGTGELILENSTKGLTNGFLKNYGEGRTRFAYALDSVYIDGDSIRFRYGPTTIAVPKGGVDTTSLSDRIDLKLNITDTADKWIGSIYRKPGEDSIFYKIGDTEYAVFDSTGGAAPTLQDVARAGNAADTSIYITHTASSTNDVLAVLRLSRSTTGTASNGIGGMIEFRNQVNTGQTVLTNQIQSYWQNADLFSRNANMKIRGVTGGSERDWIRLDGENIYKQSSTNLDTMATLRDVRTMAGGGFFSPDQTATGNTLHSTDYTFGITGTGAKYWRQVSPGTDSVQLTVGNQHINAFGSDQLGVAGFNVDFGFDEILFHHWDGVYKFSNIPDSIEGNNKMLVWNADDSTIHAVNLPVAGSGGWGLDGNSGIDTSNYIGPTDSIPFQANIAGNPALYIGYGYQTSNAPYTHYRPSQTGAVHIGVNAGLAGRYLLNAGTDVTEVVAIGPGALQDNITPQNIAIGPNAMTRNISGFRNIAAGQHAMRQSRSGSYNAMFGDFAGEVQDGVDGSALFGFGAARSSVNSEGITALGGSALQLITTWVDTIIITNGGSGYTNATITIAVADTSTPGVASQNATATAIIEDGAVVGVTMINKGRNYNKQEPPSVTITGDGDGATAQAVLASSDYNTGGGFQSFLSLQRGGYNTGFGAYSGGHPSVTARRSVYDSAMTFIGYGASRHPARATSSRYVNGTAIGANATVGCDNCVILGDSTTSVGIGTAFVHPSAKFQVNSTDRGALLPRMTSTQRTSITSPATGLIVFDTDSSSYFQYTGSVWQNLYNTGGGGGSSTDTWALNVMALVANTTTDDATQYFANYPAAWHTSGTVYTIPILRSCTLKSAVVRLYASTAGSAEAWSMYVRVNNTTDYLIKTVSESANARVWDNSSLNISLSPGDFINIKVVNPTWETNPATVQIAGYLEFQN